MSDKQEFYDKLEKQLNDTTSFPADYMFKFIVPSDENQEQEVKDLFDKVGAVIKTRASKTGKYVSISVVMNMKDAKEIIDYYKKAGKIKGIVSL